MEFGFLIESIINEFGFFLLNIYVMECELFVFCEERVSVLGSVGFLFVF